VTILKVSKSLVDDEKEVFNYDCTVAIADDGSVKVLRHGNLPDIDIREELEYQEDFSNFPAGVYLAKISWDACVSWETGIDEGNFKIEIIQPLFLLEEDSCQPEQEQQHLNKNQ